MKNEEATERNLMALEMIVGKDSRALCALFDTGVFNTICKGYMLIALKELELAGEDREKALHCLSAAFDEVTAEEAAQLYRKG